jgi:hypothetical protein
MITLTTKEWKPIRTRLNQEYSWKPSVMMIREVMKRELGFTVRSGPEWVDDGDLGSDKKMVYLDFYDEHMETLFRLKYL